MESRGQAASQSSTRAAAAGPFVYRIDWADTITDVDDAWVRFARENGAETLDASSVVGRLLWDFVAGAETRQIYRELFDKVRAGDDVTIPFRCDSPTTRRDHVMRMTKLESGGIEFECRLLHQGTQDPGPVGLLTPHRVRSDVTVLMCSWCKSVRDPVGNWLPLETAVTVLQLLSTTPPPTVTHGICPSCEAGLGAA